MGRRAARFDAPRVIARCVEFYGIDRDELASRRRTRTVARARRLTALALRRDTDLSHCEIGQQLGLTRAGVSRALSAAQRDVEAGTAPPLPPL